MLTGDQPGKSAGQGAKSGGGGGKWRQAAAATSDAGGSKSFLAGGPGATTAARAAARVANRPSGPVSGSLFTRKDVMSKAQKPTDEAAANDLAAKAAAAAAAAAVSPAMVFLVGPARCCSPSHSTHF